MQHYKNEKIVWTGEGDLEQFYSGTLKKTLEGGGQGNGATGPMWTVISIIILLIIEAFWIKATFVSALSVVIVKLTAIMYVDDTDLFLVAPYNTAFVEIGQRAQLLVSK